MKVDELKTIFSNITTWKRSGERAPHKPLLLLYGRLDRKELRLFSYAEVKENLKHLLVEFGPQRRTTPRYPFLRLSNDGIWEITGSNEIDTKRDWSDHAYWKTIRMGDLLKKYIRRYLKTESLSAS